MCHSKHLLAVGAVLLHLAAKIVDVRAEPKNKCLTDLRISTNTSATSLRIDWNYKCSQEEVKEFKIYWKQTRYLACGQDIKAEDQKQYTETTKNNIITLHELMPYSEYSVEVKAILKRSPRGSSKNRIKPESLKDMGITLGTMPEVLLKKDTRMKNSAFTTESSIKFAWSAPRDCMAYNGDLGGYYYELKGDQEDRKGYLSLDQTEVEFDGLEPYTNYSLAVYVTDVNQNLSHNALVLSQTTKPTRPPAPTDLSASIINGGYLVSWKSPEPPRGELSHYILRWKEEPSDTWMARETLEHRTVCSETDTECSYTITMLDASKNYTFQVSAYNEGVSYTDPYWSQAFHHMESMPENGSSGMTIIIALVLVVCLLLLIIIIMLVIWKCRMRKKDPFNRILQYDPDRPSPFDRDDHTRDTTRTELSVYSVRSEDSRGVPKFSENGSKTEAYKVVDIVFPIPDDTRTSTNRRSFQDPLPHRPGEEEPIYSDLDDKDKDTEEVYLPPRVASVESLDDDGYLRPNYKIHKESLEENNEGYFKPNFNRPPRIDTQDVSPDREFRPSIPIKSYDSNEPLDSNNKTKVPQVRQSAV